MARIKICRIVDRKTLKGLSALGVDYVGIHLIGSPTDHITGLLTDLFDYCRHWDKPRPVLVAKNVTLPELIDIARLVRPPLVQLHDPWSPQDIATLRAALARSTELILVVDPIEAVNVWGLKADIDLIDYVLIDHISGGTGELVPDGAMSAIAERRLGKPVFIAGGLRDTNVAERIAAYQPFAVDVQSSLEIPGRKGQKDIGAVLRFIRAAKPSSEPMVSLPRNLRLVCLSVTDHPVTSLAELDDELISEIDVFHLDDADGSIDARFIRDSLAHARKLKEAHPFTPYDLHVFIANVSATALSDVVGRYQGANPFVRGLFLYLDPEGLLPSAETLLECKAALRAKRVGLGLCFQARALTSATKRSTSRLLNVQPDYVSIVGPRDDASVSEYASLVGPFCAFLSQEKFEVGAPIIDRSISLDRLKSVVSSGVGGAVAGRTIWGTPSPLAAARMFRACMSTN